MHRPGEPTASWPRATGLLALWALAVSLVVSRAGLVLHEVLGHGVAATGAGGRVTGLRLYGFAGGWIEYADTGGWSPRAALAVAMAGIAVELATAAILIALARRRARADLAGTALVAAALGLALHGGFYLAAGAADGFGDGAPLHRALGDARLALFVPVALALAALAFLGGRRLGGELRDALPPGSRRRQAVALAAALGAAGLVHAALVAGELRLRPSPTYTRVMTTARDRAIAQELAAWQDANARAGRVVTPAERAQRQRAAAARQPRRLGPPLAIALAVAAAAGLFVAPRRARQPRRRPGVTVVPAAGRRILDLPAVARAGAAAIAAVIIVVAIDLAAAAWW